MTWLIADTIYSRLAHARVAIVHERPEQSTKAFDLMIQTTVLHPTAVLHPTPGTL